MELKLWGEVLERLREQRGLSKGDVSRKAGIERPEYRVICYKLKNGPSVDKLNRLLSAMDCTWTEWGQTYDAMAQAGTLPVKKMPVKEVPKTAWGVALERLRERKDLTLAEICRLAKIDHSQYREICYKLRDWPSVERIKGLLIAMGLTWEEWARCLIQCRRRPLITRSL